MAQENKDLRFRILASIVGGDVIGRFRNDINQTSNSANKMGTQLGSLRTGIQALAGAWITTEAIAFGKNLINVGNEMGDLSQKTGVAVEDLATLQGAAQVSGVTLQELANHLNRLSYSIGEAVTGNKQYRASFRALGIELKDESGNLKNAGDVMQEIADRFSKIGDGSAKSSLVQKLFGTSGAELIPFLNKGSAEIKKFTLSIDQEFAARAAQFNDSLAEMSISSKNFALSGIREILPALQEITDAINESPKDAGLMKVVFRDIGEIFRYVAVGGNIMLSGLLDIADFTSTTLTQAAYRFRDVWNGIAEGVYESGRAAIELAKGNFAGARDIIEQLGERGKKGFTAHLEEQGQAFGAFFDRYMARGKAASDFNDKVLKNSIFFGDGAEGALRDTAPDTSATKKATADLTELSKVRKVERDRVQEFIEQQRLENQLRIQALGDINLSALELRKVTEARKLDADAIRQSKTMTEEQRKTLMAATEEIKKQREEIIQHEFDMRRTYSYGAKEYLREYLDNVTNNANSIKSVMQTTFSSLEDTMVNFVKTGKLNFRNFADAVISELIRIAVRQAVLTPIAGALTSAISAGAAGAAAGSSGAVGSSTYNAAATSGAYTFADGGIMTSRGSLPLHKYARGGVANSPQMALFGEGRTPEAFVPLPDGRSIPVTVKNGGEGGVNVNMTINIQPGQEGGSSVESDKQTGRAMGNLIKNTVISTILEQQRPGGLLAR